ncbi:unnamed protein product [Oncorhynchus mykiss]|uniref:Uncharacterized protein n=1 Tax=Oncorhynchus mykiss TaxID=8022 RepID=A0A060XJW4_ONCMY|nr:unnamed protein product [Oncorhynchus mykiss]
MLCSYRLKQLANLLQQHQRPTQTREMEDFEDVEEAPPSNEELIPCKICGRSFFTKVLKNIPQSVRKQQLRRGRCLTLAGRELRERRSPLSNLSNLSHTLLPPLLRL